MKNTISKKIFSAFLVAALLIALLPTGVIMASATTDRTKAEAVAWANAQVGKSLDYDGVEGAQCVDLTKYYYAYLGKTVPTGNANQYYNGGTFLPSGWTYQSTPQPGDIAVDTGGKWGHVAIVTEVGSGYFIIVEQNYNYVQSVTARRLYSYSAFTVYIHPDFKSDVVTVTVSFDANGGSVSTSSKTVTVGQTYGTLPTPTRTDFSFSGWYTAKSGGSKVTSSTTVSNNSSHTLYAHWTPTGNGSWTDWSAWSTTAVSETDTRQVETKSETIGYNMVTITCGNSSGTRCYLPYMQSGYTKRAGPYEEYWDTSKMSSSTAYAPGAWYDYWDGTAVDGYIIGPGNAYVAADGYLPYYISSTATRTLYRYRDWVSHTHSYTAVVTAPTCTEQGYTTHTCSCGDSYVDTYVAALGHDWSSWSTTKPATCTQDGEQSRNCSRCGLTQTRVVSAFGHNWGEPTYEWANDYSHCTAYRVCKNNRTHFETETVNASCEIISASCTGAGKVMYAAIFENEIFFTQAKEVEVPALGHDYEAVVTEPTCTEGGYTTYTCSRCGDAYAADEVAALGHNWGNWRVSKQATCTKAGEESRTCGSCEAVETRVVAALGHDYEVEVTEPTCTEAGHKEYICRRCGYSYSAAGDPARGHRWGSGEVTVAPTVDKPGVVTFTCASCGETRMEIIPKLSESKGDYDLDGSITVADALAALRIAAKLVPDSELALLLCDSDGDGRITVSDALAILRVAAKLVASL